MGRDQPPRGSATNNTVNGGSGSNADQSEELSNDSPATTNNAHTSTSLVVTQTTLRNSPSPAAEMPEASTTSLTAEDNNNAQNAEDGTHTETAFTLGPNRPRRSAAEAGIKMREDMQKEYPYQNKGRNKPKTPNK